MNHSLIPAFGTSKFNINVSSVGYGSKLGTSIIGWLILKIDLNLRSPKSEISSHTHVVLDWLDSQLHAQLALASMAGSDDP